MGGRLSGCVVLFVVSACNFTGYSTDLPNRFRHVMTYSGSHAITDSAGSVLVGPSEYGIKLQVVEDLVVGDLDTEEPAFGVPEVPPRHFIVDTRTGRVHRELSPDDYRRQLAAYGLQTEPELIRPNATTRFK